MLDYINPITLNEFEIRQELYITLDLIKKFIVCKIFKGVKCLIQINTRHDRLFETSKNHVLI
jgi:hypothetical protein